MPTKRTFARVVRSGARVAASSETAGTLLVPHPDRRCEHARNRDRSRQLAEVVGTIAGDDTVFVATRTISVRHVRRCREIKSRRG